METELEAVNGRRVRAIEVFAHALHFFREHALKVQWIDVQAENLMFRTVLVHVLID